MTKEEQQKELGKAMVLFGNYLLSRQRQKRTSKLNARRVTKADMQNFQVLMMNKQIISNEQE